jgi:hypothetical protein
MSQFMSDDEHKEWKKAKLEAIRDYHQSLIDDLGISRTDFNMKMPFYNSRGEMVVGIFASEFKKEKGFFFELVNRGLEPTKPERTVYRVAPSTTFQDEYELNEKGSYLVSLDELRTVNPQSVAISKSSAVTSSDRFNTKQPAAPEVMYKAPAPMEDAPYSDMTIRDYYAIHTGKPVSAKTWLNELIKQK